MWDKNDCYECVSITLQAAKVMDLLGTSFLGGGIELRFSFGWMQQRIVFMASGAARCAFGLRQSVRLPSEQNVMKIGGCSTVMVCN
uniref:Uncharacterized protein n=1 Tax=Hyaloperonospora arabidopsidis (strain Emoy2) TaxID=559515 RepID=M4BAB1_HYAAE